MCVTYLGTPPILDSALTEMDPTFDILDQDMLVILRILLEGGAPSVIVQIGKPCKEYCSVPKSRSPALIIACGNPCKEY